MPDDPRRSRFSHAELTIRPARPGDLDGIGHVQRAAGHAASRETLAALGTVIDDPDRVMVVASAGDVVVGWGKTHHWDVADGVAPAGDYLGGVTVDPAWRRRGVGAALTQARVDWVRERADAVLYVTNASNVASLALHRRWGFREIARAASFHTVRFDGGVGILLRADLRPGPFDDTRAPITSG